MKLSTVLLASACLFPLVTVSHAEDINTQNIRISETSSMSMNEAPITPVKQASVAKIKLGAIDGEATSINGSNDVEVDKEKGWRWPWQKKKSKEKLKCC